MTYIGAGQRERERERERCDAKRDTVKAREESSENPPTKERLALPRATNHHIGLSRYAARISARARAATGQRGVTNFEQVYIWGLACALAFAFAFAIPVREAPALVLLISSSGPRLHNMRGPYTRGARGPGPGALVGRYRI